MKTFFSIFSVVLNPLTSEKVSLGLLLSDGNTSLFEYSSNRLTVIKSLLEPNQYTFIKNYFRSVNKSIERDEQNDTQQ